MRVTKLAPPLKDFMDFTGDEALVQIQSILSSKFDKIIIEGGVLNGPLFELDEVRTICKKLKEGVRQDVDVKTIVQFSKGFFDVLKKLDMKLKIAEG